MSWWDQLRHRFAKIWPNTVRQYLYLLFLQLAKQKPSIDILIKVVLPDFDRIGQNKQNNIYYQSLHLANLNPALMKPSLIVQYHAVRIRQSSPHSNVQRSTKQTIHQRVRLTVIPEFHQTKQSMIQSSLQCPTVITVSQSSIKQHPSNSIHQNWPKVAEQNYIINP